MTRIICQTGEVVEVEGGLDGARLSDLKLHRAILERALLVRTIFQDCDARSATFALASAEGAQFLRCSLVLAEFQGADLCRSRFEAGDAAYSDFTGANLTEAVLAGIRLDGASFRGCNLDSADLSGVEVNGLVLEGAIYTPVTVWPPAFDPTTSGAVLVGDREEQFRFVEDGPEGAPEA